MCMDYNEADGRGGVMPTYKKDKGFRPLQMTSEGIISDSVFRSGDEHSNQGHRTQRIIRYVAYWIRSRYRDDVPIVLPLDSDYMDQKPFEAMEG